jgi:radical SAM superfamily enzyme YgiQ (UPF0313 family)
MKVVFVDNFFYLRRADRLLVEISPHLGLMSLAALLEEASHDVAILDPKQVFADGAWQVPGPAFYLDWADGILALKPDIVGFTALGRTLPHAIAAASAIKARRPGLPILIGGPHATILGPALLEAFDCLDVVVRYEAETIIRHVVEAVHSRHGLSSIPNLAFRARGQVVETRVNKPLTDMNSLPFPAYHLYPRQALAGKELAIESGRGCPFACTFCSTANFFQRRYRLKPTDRLIRDMEQLRADMGTAVIDLNHDLFGLNIRSLRHFCRGVADRGFKWKCSMRPDTVDTALLGELLQAGCVSIYFGVESGSARMQERMAKRLDLDAAVRNICSAVEAGLVCTASFVTGFPDETGEDLDATLDLIGRLCAFSPDRLLLQLHILSPEPGSELADGDRPMHFDGFGPEMDEFVDAGVILRHSRIFSVFYHFDTLLSRSRVLHCAAFVTFVMPLLGHRLLSLILDRHFDGRLSRLLERIVADTADSRMTFASIIESLWSGLEDMAVVHAGESPFLRELIRFSRIYAECQEQAAAGAGGQSSEDITIARFEYPVADIARELLLHGSVERLLPIRPNEIWYAFRVDPGDKIDIIPLDSGEVTELQELYRCEKELLAYTSQTLSKFDAMTLAKG